MKITERRRARETALKILYREAVVAGSTDKSFNSVIEGLSGDKHRGAREYCEKLLEGVKNNVEDIDSLIESSLKNWSIDRLGILDLNILRIAVFELKWLGDEVPFKVAIDEALELAKRYSADESARFINGVLDAVAKSV